MDIGGAKLQAAQSRVDVITRQIDEVTGQITKANVGVKTAERCVFYNDPMITFS